MPDAPKDGVGAACGHLLFPFRSSVKPILLLYFVLVNNPAPYSQGFQLKTNSTEANKDGRQTDESVTTILTEEIKGRLTEGILTSLRAGGQESIFEFENDAYSCGPSELGGSIFDPSSYTCSASCELDNGEPTSAIGVFHNDIVNNVLPTLQAVRSTKIAMNGRDNVGQQVDDPIGGIAFVVNLLHTSENPICLLVENPALTVVSELFAGMEDLTQILKKVKVPQIKLIAKMLQTPLRKINSGLDKTIEQLEDLCEKTTHIHIIVLDLIRDVRSTLTTLDIYTSLMLPPMVEATCVSDNIFTLADELVSAIEERDESLIEPKSAYLLKTGNQTLHDRRQFAAGLTPNSGRLPIRRALMYSDWEKRFEVKAGATEDADTDMLGGQQERALRQPLTELTTDIVSASVTAMNVFLNAFEILDETFRTFGIIWVDVALAAETFSEALQTLFDGLEPFQDFFDGLFKIGDVFQSLTCPSFAGFVCFIEDLIAEAIDIIFAPLESIFMPLIDQLVDLISLPDIDFSFPELLPDPLPWEKPIERIHSLATTLVQEVVSPFIDDPLPLLYKQNPRDKTGLDVLYSGVRRDTTVGIEDCDNTYGTEKRLPMLFHGIQRSAWCPRGYDFTAASVFPCGGLGGVDLVTGDDCVVSSDGKVPLVCVNENYPPEFYNEDGTLNFPDFLPPRSDYILQAHYACARESTVFELGALPAEVLATQGNGELSCSLGRYAVDFAEIGTPCSDQRFLDDPRGSTGYTNDDACKTIDSNEYISELSSYLDLWNAQVAAHAACDGDHMCLVGVWINKEKITGLLEDLVPPELKKNVDRMVDQHLVLYDWGTSNPIRSNLESSFTQPKGVKGKEISGLNSSTYSSNPRVSGNFDKNAKDRRVLSEIQCGEGSYLERLKFKQYRESRYKGRSSEEIATIAFSCYGDRDREGTTLIDFPTGTGGGLKHHRTIDMNCSGKLGGFRRLAVKNKRKNGDTDDWRWEWRCMDGTKGSKGPNVKIDSWATCGTKTPIQSLEHYWHRNKGSQKFRPREETFKESILLRVSCDERGSPLERSRDLTLKGFAEDTHVGRYVARRDAKIAEYEPDVPVCESIAIENAANCNALPLDEASSTCNLPTECDSAGVRYYCPVPGLDTELPEPEKVATAFGDNNLKDAVVECPDGMVYLPLEVTQGVPPFGGASGLGDFIAAGCDGTNSTCVYTSPNGESARIVYQCICGEGFRPLTNEEGGCDFCPLGTHRPFVVPRGGSGATLADSCLSCPAGTYGGPESDTSPVPTCHLCPENTYSDKVGAVGEGICTKCLAGYFTDADGGSTSIDECVECGVNFQCPLGGERTPCPVGSWTNGGTVSTSCVSCPPGTFYPTDVALNATCTPCPPGTFSDAYGRSECTPCPAGTFGRDSGADTCEVCPQGTYQDQEGATVCQECDATRPYTGSVQTSDVAGCWDEDVRSSIGMVIRGLVTVEVSEDTPTNLAAGEPVRSRRLQSIEDPQVVINVLEASLLAWVNSWATNVINGEKVIIDTSNTFPVFVYTSAMSSAALGDIDGQYILSFKADADGVLSTEAKELLRMRTYPVVLIDMMTSVAQSVSYDPETNLTMSPVPVEQSLNATVVSSNGQVLPPELIDFQSPELVDLTCEDLLARFTTSMTNAIYEVGDGFCNGGVWNSPQCNYDGGDCCSSTCTPVALAELISRRVTTAHDCLTDEIGDGYCDFENNNKVCGFDGGDCCSGTCVPGSGGECLDGTFDCRDGSEPSEDTAPRVQSCAPRTMQCLDPAAVEVRPVGFKVAAQIRALDPDSPGNELPSERGPARRLQELLDEEECASPMIQWGDGVCDARLNTEACGYDGGDCCAETCVQNPLYPTSCLYYDCEDPSMGANELVATDDTEAPVLKNVPAQDPNMISYQCVPPATYQVIAVDNDPRFKGGVVMPVDEIPAGADNCSFTLTRTWAAEDFNYNSVQVQRTYNVVHNQPPILTGLPPDGVVVQTDDPNFTFDAAASVIAVDACSGLGVPVVYTEERAIEGDGCIRNVGRTWTAEDACGNSVSMKRTATLEISSVNCNVGPTPTPAITCAADPTVTTCLAPT